MFRHSVTSQQSASGNNDHRTPLKYTTIFTLSVGKLSGLNIMQVCLEDMCNFPNLQYCIYHICELYC